MNEKTLQKFARLILGVILIIFGINMIVPFMPAFEGTQASTAFFTALGSTGFFFPFLGITKIVVGLLLVTKKTVPLALVILAPISIQIILFHIFLDPANILMGLVVAILNLYLGIK
jgi:Na+/phosphate symporter